MPITSFPITQSFWNCAEHGSHTAVLCAKFQNDSTTELDFMNKWDFARFEFMMDNPILHNPTGSSAWTSPKQFSMVEWPQKLLSIYLTITFHSWSGGRGEQWSYVIGNHFALWYLLVLFPQCYTWPTLAPCQFCSATFTYGPDMMYRLLPDFIRHTLIITQSKTD